jgi:hypothetical protein
MTLIFKSCIITKIGEAGERKLVTVQTLYAMFSQGMRLAAWGLGAGGLGEASEAALGRAGGV